MPSTSTPYRYGRKISALLRLPSDVRLSALPTGAIQQAIGKEWFGDATAPSLFGMGVKRRAEFLAGRLCAAWSLRMMGVAAPFPLPVHDRLPIWPSNVVGSISHCNSLAVALTAPRSEYRAVGIDVESLINTPTASEMRRLVGCDEEWVRLEKHVPCQQQALTQLFSAKEALYKALFPSVGHFKDFDAARFCNYESGTLLLRLTHDWSSCWPADTHVRVHQGWLGQVLVSAVCTTQANQA